MRILRHIIAGSRYMLIIAVFGTFVASITVLLYGGLTLVLLINTIITQYQFKTDEIKQVAFTSIELIDLFLISTILYIFSLALYSLFIDNKLPLPRWLIITNLNDLERTLLSVLVVLLTITFLGFAVDWSFGDYSIVALGIAIGVVIFPIGYQLSRSGSMSRVARTNETNSETEAWPSIEENL